MSADRVLIHLEGGMTFKKEGEFLTWATKAGFVCRAKYAARTFRRMQEIGERAIELARKQGRPVYGHLIQKGPRGWRIVVFSCQKALTI
jgi:hypothetical protein